MRTVMLNEPKMTIDELVEKLRSSDQSVFAGTLQRYNLTRSDVE